LVGPIEWLFLGRVWDLLENTNLSNEDREIIIKMSKIYLYKEAKLISIKYKKIFISTKN